jgi:hypothetical protein
MCIYLFGIDKSERSEKSKKSKKSNKSKIVPKSKPRYQDPVDNTSEHIPPTPESKSKFIRIIV